MLLRRIPIAISALLCACLAALAQPALARRSFGSKVAFAAAGRGRRRPPTKSTEGGAGFGEDKVATPTKRDNDESKSIYSLPALYDLAFGYRPYDDEVDFLVSQHQLLHEGKPPKRVLELAAGPARHSIEAIQSNMVQSITALDLSEEMKQYSLSVAEETIGKTEMEDRFKYLIEDIRSFDFAENDMFDSAWILLGSLQHLTTNDEVVQCFKNVHNNLSEGGTLILELPHPRESFALGECTRNYWKVPLEDDNEKEYGHLEIIWGDDDDDFDPIAQIRQFTVDMRLTGAEDQDGMQNVRQIVPMRIFTSQEMNALAQLAGFDVIAQYGALDQDVGVHDGDEAFRLVCVLQKK